jgi:hypothetical protein
VQSDIEENGLGSFKISFEFPLMRATDYVPQPRKREECCTPVVTDCGSVSKLASRSEKRGDQSEGFRGKLVDGRERIPDVLRFPADIQDPRNRIIDLR